MHSTRREVMARLQEDCCYELRELCMLTTDQMIQVSFSFGFIQKDWLYTKRLTTPSSCRR